jgi:hypothetical protein
MAEIMINKSRPLGLHCITTLCHLLSDPQQQTAINLLRGVVFLLSNAGWGNMQLTTVAVHPAHVMSAYFIAAEYEHPAVTFEIVISLNMLAKKLGRSLDAATWDALTKVLGSAMKVWDELRLPMLCAQMEELLKLLEQLLRDGEYTGSPDLLIALLESHPGDRDMTFALGYKLEQVCVCVCVCARVCVCVCARARPIAFRYPALLGAARGEVGQRQQGTRMRCSPFDWLLLLRGSHSPTHSLTHTLTHSLTPHAPTRKHRLLCVCRCTRRCLAGSTTHQTSFSATLSRSRGLRSS